MALRRLAKTRSLSCNMCCPVVAIRRVAQDEQRGAEIGRNWTSWATNRTVLGVPARLPPADGHLGGSARALSMLRAGSVSIRDPRAR